MNKYGGMLGPYYAGPSGLSSGFASFGDAIGKALQNMGASARERQDRAKMEQERADKANAMTGFLSMVNPEAAAMIPQGTWDPALIGQMAQMAQAKQQQDKADYWAADERGRKQAGQEQAAGLLGQLYPNIQVGAQVDPSVALAVAEAQRKAEQFKQTMGLQEKELGLKASNLDRQNRLTDLQIQGTQQDRYRKSYEEGVLKDFLQTGKINPDAAYVPDQVAAALGKRMNPEPKAYEHLQDKFVSESKPFIDTKQGFNRILVSADPRIPDDNRAQADLSLIYAYMKMLDPGSTVREGEYATAEQARGVPATILQKYNKVIQGDKLDESQRRGFTAQAAKIYERDLASHNQMIDEYKRFASKLGLDPALVVKDYTGDVSKFMEQPWVVDMLKLKGGQSGQSQGQKGNPFAGMSDADLRKSLGLGE